MFERSYHSVPAGIPHAVAADGRFKTVRGLSLRSIATTIGVSPQYYNENERGNRSVLTAERLEKYRAYLGLIAKETGTLFNKNTEVKHNRQNPRQVKCFHCRGGRAVYSSDDHAVYREKYGR